MIEDYYYIALTMIDGIGHVNAKKLIAYCSGASNVFSASTADLKAIPGIGTKMASQIRRKEVLESAEEVIKDCERKRIKVLSMHHPSYPQRLKHCVDAPIVLYLKGEIDLNLPRVLSVVGTRNITSHGKQNCDQLIAGLQQYTPLIVSGLAFGVDVQSHRAALQNGLPTLGCVAHGLDHLYPVHHHRVVAQMLQHGGIISEHLNHIKPERNHFPMRNRIIAGISDATLVIESGDKGGSMITANIAHSYDREVLAVPGRPSDIQSVGCNRIINRNRAVSVTSAEEIAFCLGWDLGEVQPAIQTSLFETFNQEEEQLMVVLNQKKQVSIDELSIATGMSVSAVSTVLLSLEFRGVVRSKPGKIYEST